MKTAPLTGRLCYVETFDAGNAPAERNTRRAIALSILIVAVEIVGGWMFNSMALLADGWHMASHVLALGLSAFAYAAARRFARDARFAFGAWKIEILGGYTSAVFLVGVAAVMLYQSIARLIFPAEIHYDQALVIACLGLAVNLACAWLLRGAHEHARHSDGEYASVAHHYDLNQRSAYLHVIADAATSALAIVALTGGKFWNFGWLDPVMGIVGAALVALWARGLLRDTGRVLLDAEMDAPTVAEVRKIIAGLPCEMTDLHLWRVGRGKYACIVALTGEGGIQPEDVRQRLAVHDELAHITIEINRRH
jgi:cation diffusion facilitator family transporter